MSERLSYPVEIMAKLLLLTPRRVQQLANEGVIHKSERGRYDLIKSVQGYIQYLNDLLPNKSSSDAGQQFARADLVSEQIKLTKHKAELARIEEEEKKGLMVYAEDERRDGFQIARTVRNGILNIPPRIAQDLALDSDPNSVYRKLEAALIESMTELADILEAGEPEPAVDVAESESSDDTEEAAA